MATAFASAIAKSRSIIYSLLYSSLLYSSLSIVSPEIARLALVCSDMERAACVAVAVAAATACERVSLVEVVGDGLAANTSLRRHADAVVDALALACARALGPADAVDFDVLFAFQCGNTVIQLGEVCLSGEARRVDSDLDLGNAVDDGVDVVRRPVR